MSTKTLTKKNDLFPSTLNEFFKPWNEWFNGGWPSGNGWLTNALTIPAANIVESKDEYKVSLAVPGLKKEDFDINIDGNILNISSEKEQTKEEKEATYTRKEYNYSSFQRSFTLPNEVNKEKIAAGYENGVLTLSLPKTEEAKKATITKHIAVK